MILFNFHYYIGKDNAVRSPKTRILADESIQSSPADRLLSSESLNKITESKKFAKPVPAPRISLENQSRGSSSDEITPRKPVIPEKPTTLPRPFSCSFKSMKIGDLPEKPDVRVMHFGALDALLENENIFTIFTIISDREK